MKESLRLIFTLTAIAAIAGFLVALADAATREPIARARTRAFNTALREVLPAGVPDPEPRVVRLADGISNTVYVADGAIALEARSPNGYAGDIVLLLGFTAEDRLHNYTVLDHKETPGLGAHIAGAFRASVTNRPAATTAWKVKKDGGDIDAITAATISSRAVCEAIAGAAARLGEIRRALEGAPAP
jgi:electron transport complex protein RnfG